MIYCHHLQELPDLHFNSIIPCQTKLCPLLRVKKLEEEFFPEYLRSKMPAHLTVGADNSSTQAFTTLLSDIAPPGSQREKMLLQHLQSVTFDISSPFFDDSNPTQRTDQHPSFVVPSLLLTRRAGDIVVGFEGNSRAMKDLLLSVLQAQTIVHRCMDMPNLQGRYYNPAAIGAQLKTMNDEVAQLRRKNKTSGCIEFT